MLINGLFLGAGTALHLSLYLDVLKVSSVYICFITCVLPLTIFQTVISDKLIEIFSLSILMSGLLVGSGESSYD